MTVFVAEQSITGLCFSLYLAYTKKVFPDIITNNYGYCGSITDKVVFVECEKTQGERVYNAILKYGGGETVNDLQVCLNACEETAFKTAFDYARLVLDRRHAVFTELADKRVSEFTFLVNKVRYERHRILGFIRFKETESGILYAPYSPDNDITEMVMPHFLQRLSGTPFAIHDVKRGKVGISDGKSFKVFFTEDGAELNLSEEEKEWESLWKRYYKSVNIKERKNKAQQNRCMPVRYRKFMSETQT